MEIRKLGTEEKQNTKKLYEEVFSEDSKSFVDYYYEEKLKDNQIYAVEEDGEIQAMLHLNPYELAVNGSKKDVNYIVAVATRESYRKRGYMAGLLKQALNDMYADGETFTFLMPASESIYLPFDFRTVCEQNRSYYDPEEETEEGVVITDAVNADAEEMAAYMEAQLTQSYQVYAKRSTAYYERLIKEYASDGGILKIYKKDGKITDRGRSGRGRRRQTKDHDPYRRCQKNADVIAPAIIYGYMLYCNGSNYRREQSLCDDHGNRILGCDADGWKAGEQ